jgi:O-antigen chain-terminating methyltransferase
VAGITPNWAEADAHAALGMPVARGTKFRLVRRLIAKALWPFLSHQVAVNRALLAELDAVRERLDSADLRLDRAFGDLEHHSGVLVRHEEPIDRHEFLLKALEPAVTDLLRQIDLVSDKVDLGQRQALARQHENLAPIRAALSELAQKQHAWQIAMSDYSVMLGQLDVFLSEVKRALPEPPAIERFASIATGKDALTPVLSEAFRGSVPTIKERVRIYVEDLRAIGAGGPVLDIGCGRGELLEELQAAGIEAYGVDLDPKTVEKGRARGLDIRLEDARTHLLSLEPGSLNALCAIHVVEHLDIDELIEVIELAARAIRPGGLLIFETPNPENVVVASSSFYLDPTHKRPLPPALLSFLVGVRGFDDVEVRRLERLDFSGHLDGPSEDDPSAELLASIVDVLNQHLLGPPDYAVVARRP